ncbi:MAG: ATP-binding protein [Candidatus Omnitrophica bacterium]|jgi:serine/threonine-protein kinase RsbW|nr:ATP-binding protein [Candidatus Omnitrophota bacterium]
MKELEFEIPSDPEYIKDASEKVLGFLEGLELTKEILFDIRLCLEEAVINAIKYGNKLEKAIPVSIRVSFSEGRLEIMVKDCGKGFQYSDIPDPRSSKNILKHGGRGLFLIRNLMDEVVFNDSGNEIKMIKSISGGKSDGG